MSEKNTKLQALKFAALLSLICSLLITSAATGLKKYQLANIETDKQKNILKAANLLEETKKYNRDDIEKIYGDSISEVSVSQTGEVLQEAALDSLKLYFYKKEDKVISYIIPIETRGLWGKIMGYIAFENDGQTVSGFTVYSHSETPGLGGEIEKNWFGKNFKGKKIINSENRFVSVGIAKGSTKALSDKDRTHYVDGISGATLTGKYLTQGIKETLEVYEPVSVKFRNRNALH